MSLEQLEQQFLRHLGVKPVFSELQYLEEYGWHMSMSIPGARVGIEHWNDDPAKIKPELIRQAFECYTPKDLAELRDDKVWYSNGSLHRDSGLNP